MCRLNISGGDRFTRSAVACLKAGAPQDRAVGEAIVGAQPLVPLRPLLRRRVAAGNIVARSASLV
jgi:hypothetical protein